MEGRLHSSTRTTPRIRAELQASQESNRKLAARNSMNFFKKLLGALAESIILPEKGLGDAGAAQFCINPRPFWHWSFIAGDRVRRRKKNHCNSASASTEGQVKPLAAKRLR